MDTTNARDNQGAPANGKDQNAGVEPPQPSQQEHKSYANASASFGGAPSSQTVSSPKPDAAARAKALEKAKCQPHFNALRTRWYQYLKDPANYPQRTDIPTNRKAGEIAEANILEGLYPPTWDQRKPRPHEQKAARGLKHLAENTEEGEPSPAEGSDSSDDEGSSSSSQPRRKQEKGKGKAAGFAASRLEKEVERVAIENAQPVGGGNPQGQPGPPQTPKDPRFEDPSLAIPFANQDGFTVTFIDGKPASAETVFSQGHQNALKIHSILRGLRTVRYTSLQGSHAFTTPAVNYLAFVLALMGMIRRGDTIRWSVLPRALGYLGFQIVLSIVLKLSGMAVANAIVSHVGAMSPVKRLGMFALAGISKMISRGATVAFVETALSHPRVDAFVAGYPLLSQAADWFSDLKTAMFEKAQPLLDRIPQGLFNPRIEEYTVTFDNKPVPEDQVHDLRPFPQRQGKILSDPQLMTATIQRKFYGGFGGITDNGAGDDVVISLTALRDMVSSRVLPPTVVGDDKLSLERFSTYLATVTHLNVSDGHILRDTAKLARLWAAFERNNDPLHDPQAGFHVGGRTRLF